MRTCIAACLFLAAMALAADDKPDTEKPPEKPKPAKIVATDPEKAGPDAMRIAAAAVEECEFLLTWNFRHIANVRIRREVERILANHGYTKTTICTPEELV